MCVLELEGFQDDFSLKHKDIFSNISTQNNILQTWIKHLIDVTRLTSFVFFYDKKMTKF